jgi:CRP/FNR family transcriptional regulator, nitrogen oxide reductase regulator
MKRKPEQVGLLRNISHTDLDAIVRSARERRFPRDTYFFRQGDPATILYLLERGRVKLTQHTPEGDQVLSSLVGPGELFGIAALEDGLHRVSAQAARDSVALAWDRGTFARLMVQYATLARGLVSQLARQVGELRQRNLELATESVECRIAGALLRLAGTSGRKVDDHVLIDLPLSRKDIAEMTGTTPFTVSRILNTWQDKSIVMLVHKRVLICSLQSLVLIAEGLPQD